MEITLSPETTRRVRDVLGDDVDLSPGAVPSALARLAVEAPRVYSQVLAELSGTEIRLDSERVLVRRRWWSVVRRHLFWWAEYQSDAGERLIAKRHVAAAVPLGLAGVILLLLAGSTMFRHHVPAAAARRPAVAVVPRPAFALTRAVDPTRALAAHAFPPLVDLPIPPLGLPASGATASAPAAQGEPGAEPPRDPLVFHLDPEPSPTAATTATPAPRDGGVDAAAGRGSPVVYDRARDEAESGVVPATGSASSVGRGEGPMDVGSAEQRLTPGARVGARLATGVLVASGGSPSPAIAETTSPAATWLGQATLGADGRVQIAFTVARPGAVVRGVALDPDRLVPGLAGRTELRQPQAAAAALTVAARAAAEYTRALAQQGLALAGSWGQLTLGQAAPPWAYLASSFADGIAPRSGVPGPVETSEISAGVPLLILVTEAP